MGLAAALLPPIPDAAAAMLQDLPPSPAAAITAAGAGQPAAAVARQGQRQAAAAAAEAEAGQRAAFLRDNPALLQQLSADMLPLMIKVGWWRALEASAEFAVMHPSWRRSAGIPRQCLANPHPPSPPPASPFSPHTQVFGSSVTPLVKRQCLTTLAKMLHFNSAETLAALLQDLPASSLIAALLGARDSTVVAFGMQVGGQPAGWFMLQCSVVCCAVLAVPLLAAPLLVLLRIPQSLPACPLNPPHTTAHPPTHPQMAEVLMEKLPEVFGQYFLKEGVVHAMDQLAAVQPLPGGDAGEVSPASGKAPARRASGAARPASRAVDKDGGESGSDALLHTRTPAGDTLRAAVGVRARRFIAKYFTDGRGHTVGKC